MVNQSQPGRCAFCGEPFPFVGGRAQAWRVGDRYACNEFCADGVEDASLSRRQSGETMQSINL